MAATLKWDTREFDATLRRYADLSKKDPKVICDTKALFIMRGALRNTPKSSKAEIRENLLAIGRNGAPIAASIINKGRKPGLNGKAMREAIASLIKSRRVATLKAGWIPGIKELNAIVPNKRGAPATGTLPQTFGKPKGWAKPASGLWKAETTFANLSGAIWDTRNGANAKAEPALAQAFADETRSMMEYMERKLKETATKAGIKHG